MDNDITFEQPSAFNTLSHVTSLQNTQNILQEDFKMQVVGDYSCVNKLTDKQGCYHPLYSTPFFWMAPDNHDTTTAVRYGNVSFSLKSLEKLEQLKFYYVEFLDYVTKTAARIMLTTKDYDHLFNRFDPLNETMEAKVPILFKDKEWLRYTSFSNASNDEILLDVEFLLDVIPLQQAMYCKYVKCFDPRPIVTTYGRKCGAVLVYNGKLDIFRLISLLARFQGFYSYEFRSPSFTGELIFAIQAVSCTNEFIMDEDLDVAAIDHRNSACKKADIVLSEIDFGKAFDMQEIQTADWQNIQILDFIFQRSGTLPNVQTMLNVLTKAISKMESEKTFGQIFTVFFRCFLSSGAKQRVKKHLVNVLCGL